MIRASLERFWIHSNAFKLSSSLIILIVIEHLYFLVASSTSSEIRTWLRLQILRKFLITICWLGWFQNLVLRFLTNHYCYLMVSFFIGSKISMLVARFPIHSPLKSLLRFDLCPPPPTPTYFQITRCICKRVL